MAGVSQINVAELYKLLGGLERGLQNVSDDVKDIKEAQEEAKEARSDMAEALGDLISRMNAMEKDVKISKDMADEVKEWKQRGIGALFVVGLGSSALTAVLVKAWASIVAFWNLKVGG